MRKVILIFAAILLAGCSSDATLRTSMFTWQHKMRSPPGCSSVPAPETNSTVLRKP